MEPADTWGGERGRKSEGEKERAREAERVAKKEGGQEWNEEKLVNERESDSLTCQSTQSGNRGATERGGIIEATIRLPLPPLRSFQPLYRSSCRAPTLRSLPFFFLLFSFPPHFCLPQRVYSPQNDGVVFAEDRARHPPGFCFHLSCNFDGLVISR